VATDVQLQTNNKTFLGRYWTEHTVLRRYVPSDNGVSILSFGCSTGEELAGLQVLFPAARLFGCDIDWHNLQCARALLGDRATIFASADGEVLRHGPFDVILCNSVLMGPTTVKSGRKQGIDAARWTDVLGVLAEALKPGGILQIINSNIPFRFHPAAAGFQPLRSPLVLGPNFVDQFDLRGRHLCSGVAGVGWSAVLSRHLGEEAWPDMLPTDLQDVHFCKTGRILVPQPVGGEEIPNLPGGDCLVGGTMTYRPTPIDDPRPATHIEIDVAWQSVGADGVRLRRSARRIWFDGRVVDLGDSTVEMTGATATAFLEASTGRRSTRLTMETLASPAAIRAPAF
jgi:hypothetical protein